MNKEIEQLNTLINIGKKLTSVTDVDQLLLELNNCAKDICDSEWASILLVDKNTNELYFKTSAGGQAHLVKKIRLSMGTGIAGWVAQQNTPLIVNDVLKDPRFLGNIDDKFKIETRNILAVPINFNGETIGVIEVGNKNNGELYSEKEKSYLEVIASQAGVALHNAFLVGSLNNFKVHSLDIIVAAIDEVSPFKTGHSVEVARVATFIARELGLNDGDYQNVYYASLLHDLGFIRKGLPDIETKHPAIGSSIIEHIDVFKDIAPIIAAHHEKFDGSGSPNGLLGKDIPLGARIVGFAEACIEHYSEGLGGDPFKNSSQYDNNVLLASRKFLAR